MSFLQPKLQVAAERIILQRVYSSEVDYFTIKENNLFHVFDANEVIRIIDDSTVAANSKAIQDNQMDDQKVIFKLSNNP